MPNKKMNKNREVESERDKATGLYVPKGTDKVKPKETSMSKGDRPAKYKKRIVVIIRRFEQPPVVF